LGSVGPRVRTSGLPSTKWSEPGKGSSMDTWYPPRSRLRVGVLRLRTTVAFQRPQVAPGLQITPLYWPRNPWGSIRAGNTSADSSNSKPNFSTHGAGPLSLSFNFPSTLMDSASVDSLTHSFINMNRIKSPGQLVACFQENKVMQLLPRSATLLQSRTSYLSPK